MKQICERELLGLGLTSMDGMLFAGQAEQFKFNMEV